MMYLCRAQINVETCRINQLLGMNQVSNVSVGVIQKAWHVKTITTAINVDKQKLEDRKTSNVDSPETLVVSNDFFFLSKISTVIFKASYGKSKCQIKLYQ